MGHDWLTNIEKDRENKNREKKMKRVQFRHACLTQKVQGSCPWSSEMLLLPC